ncbi:unnamed protein product, partial [Sphacelaria rigidula]
RLKSDDRISGVRCVYVLWPWWGGRVRDEDGTRKPSSMSQNRGFKCCTLEEHQMMFFVPDPSLLPTKLRSSSHRAVDVTTCASKQTLKQFPWHLSFVSDSLQYH